MKSPLAVVCVFATATVLSAAGCGGSSSSTSGGKEAPKTANTTPKVVGTLKPSVLLTGDQEAIRLLKHSDVWCRWNDGQVEIGATFTNGSAAHITVKIQPNYRLKRAGLHGDGLGSIKDIGLDGDQTRVWSDKIGKPGGVSGQPRITECAPELFTVELG